jgi:hypothetical protein
MQHLPRKSAKLTAGRAAQSEAQPLLALAGEGGVSLHTMPRGCRRFDLPKAGRVVRPTLVVIGDSRSPARPGDYPAAGVALRWARVAIIRTPGGGSTDYAAVAVAVIQNRTAVLIETTPAHLEVWQALAAAAHRGQARAGQP